MSVCNLDRTFAGSSLKEDPYPCFSGVTFEIIDDRNLSWTQKCTARIQKWTQNWNPFEGFRVRVGMYDTRLEAEQAYRSAKEEMARERAKQRKERKERKEVEELEAVFWRAFFGKNDGSISSFQVLPVLEYLDGIVSRPGDTRTAVSSHSSYHRYRAGPESDHDAGIQNPTGNSRIFCKDSVCDPLLFDHGLSKTYSILRNVNLPICERWIDVGSTMSRIMGNALKEPWSMQSGGPNTVSNVIGLFKNASKLAVGMVVIGNTLAVGAVRAMAPEAVEPGSVQTSDFEKSSNFAFGVVSSIGALVAIIAFVKSVNFCRRRHSLAGTSAASAPSGAILNRAVNMPQTLTVLRSWRETEYREVVVARRVEDGAYAS